MINERREERVPGETPFYYYCFDQAKKKCSLSKSELLASP